jgi:hypothetical protein
MTHYVDVLPPGAAVFPCTAHCHVLLHPHDTSVARRQAAPSTRGLSVKIPNNANKSFSHYLGATDLCPLPGTLLHFSYITPTFLPVLQAFLECLFWNTAKLCQRLFFNFLDTSIVVTSVWISAW